MGLNDYNGLRRSPQGSRPVPDAKLPHEGNAMSDDDRILYGVPAIASHMKLRVRQVHHLKDRHGLPTFLIGRTVCAKASALAAWIEAHAATEAGDR
jgi:hypothetical protein